MIRRDKKMEKYEELEIEVIEFEESDIITASGDTEWMITEEQTYPMN